MHDLATGQLLSERAPVFIVGQLGVGKSHLAQAPGHCAICQGIEVLFTPCVQLTASLNAAPATGAYERKLATLARIALLIIDDFGLKPLRPPADENLHDLIAERCDKAATIVTGNLDFSTNGTKAFPAIDCLPQQRSIGCVMTLTARARRSLRPQSQNRSSGQAVDACQYCQSQQF